MEQQVASLTPCMVKLFINDDQELGIVEVHYQLLFTMIDGKVDNAVSGVRSSQVCYLCGAKPWKMKNMKYVFSLMVHKDRLLYGISSLHLWIRNFECLLHIAFRLDFRSWQVRTEKKKVCFEQRKVKFKAIPKYHGIDCRQTKRGGLRYKQ